MNNTYTEKVKKAVETFKEAEQVTHISRYTVPKYQTDIHGQSVLFINPPSDIKRTDIESTNKLTELDGEHTHILAHHPNAYNEDGVHSDTNGLVYHTHDFEIPKEKIPAEQKRDGEFKENWINVAKEPHKGLEINLTKLNKAESVCELTSPFYWTERYNKCLQK
jgi:hypothetical protein